jgi:tRNA(Ser,Leu) C12 N-acetylase TAN1
MKDWNVVVTTHEKGYVLACEAMAEIGAVSRTEFFNVLVMRVPDPRVLPDRVADMLERDPGLLRNALSHVAPLERTFTFQAPDEFERKAREAALTFVAALAGRSFHVRLHRRGFKGRLSSPVEERFLDGVLLDATAATGAPARLSFDDPDAVLDLETVGNRGGLALWTREDRARYPFLPGD